MGIVADAIYLGDTAADAVYAGADQVWPAAGGGPESPYELATGWITAMWTSDANFGSQPTDGATVLAGQYPYCPITGNPWRFPNSYRPSWVADMAGTGRGAFRFAKSGTNNESMRQPVGVSVNPSPATVIIVGRIVGQIYSCFCDSDFQYRRVGTDGTSWQLQTMTGSTTAADTNLHIFYAVFNHQGRRRLYVDNAVTFNVSDTTNSTGQELYLGAKGSPQAPDPGVDIAFAGVLDHEITFDERAALLTWYQSHYLGL